MLGKPSSAIGQLVIRRLPKPKQMVIYRGRSFCTVIPQTNRQITAIDFPENPGSAK